MCFFKTIDDIPKNWTTLRKYFLNAGLKSSLILPLKVGGALIGGIGMDFICKHITMVLEKAKWRIAGPSGAAHQLGLHPNTLHSKMKKLGIKKPWQ